MKKTKLYIVSNSKDGKQSIDGIYYLIAEDGECLYSHWCSSIGYAKNDLIGETYRSDRVEECKKKYGEFDILFLGEDEMTMEKLLELNHKNYPDKEG